MTDILCEECNTLYDPHHEEVCECGEGHRVNTQILSHPSGAKVFLVSDADYKALKNLAENAEDKRIRDVLGYVLGSEVDDAGLVLGEDQGGACDVIISGKVVGALTTKFWPLTDDGYAKAELLAIAGRMEG